MLATKGMRFPIELILVCIRWYAAYPLSYRHLEEMMMERGVFVDHSSINRWAIRFLPLLEKGQTRLEILVPRGGQGRKDGRLCADDPVRKKSAALHFFDKAMKASGVPEKVTIDKSGANKAAMDEINGRGETPIIVRQVVPQ